MTILTAREIKALADAIPRDSDRLAIYVASYCGLRAGELWALQRRDIDLLHNRLHVQRALKDIRGHLEFGDTKTTGSRRAVSLPAFLRSMLTEHMKSSPRILTPSCSSPPAAEALARQATADPCAMAYSCAASSSQRSLATRTRAASQHSHPHEYSLRFHDLRHTCASLLIAAGAHPKLIQARLGHSSITPTLDRYGHLFPSVEAA